MPTTVGKVADELGLDHAAVISACARVGVLAWSEHTPLDDAEEAQVRSALATPVGPALPAPGAAGPSFPPPGAPSFPPPGAPSYPPPGAPSYPPPGAPSYPPPGPTVPPPPPGATPYGAGFPPPPPGYPAGPVGPTRTHGLAITAFVLGLVGWIPIAIGSIVAIVLGFRAVKQIDRPGSGLSGRGLAVAGIALGFVGCGFWALAAIGFIIGDDSVPNNAGETGQNLAVGDCYDNANGTSTELKTAVVHDRDCNTPHDAEVFALVSHPAVENAPYPGTDQLTVFATNRCSTEAADFFPEGGPGNLGLYFIIPTEPAWTQLDSRRVVCSVYDPTGAKLVAPTAPR